MKLIRLSILLGFFVLSSCDFSLPMQGVKIDQIKKQDYVIVVMTYGKLGDDKDKNRNFWIHTNKIRDDLKKIKGVFGYKFKRNVFNGETYSYIIFKDKESVAKFGNMPSHRMAVTKDSKALVSSNIEIMKIPAKDYNVSWPDIEKILHGRK